MKLPIIASIVCVAAVASAEPVSTTASTTSYSTATYVEPGYMITTTPYLPVDAVTFEAGHQLGHGPFGVHALAALGGPVHEPGGFGLFVMAHAGLEARGCVFDGTVCGVAGVDAGARYFDNADGFNREMTTSGMILAPRVGLDLGRRWLRVRPGLEAIMDGRTTDVAGTVGVAFAW